MRGSNGRPVPGMSDAPSVGGDPRSTTSADALGDEISPPQPNRLDVVMAALSVVLVGGLFLDLWAHNHGRVDESFLTPWHGFLYAGAALFGAVLFNEATRGRRAGKPISRSLPAGYGLSLVGAALFLGAGLVDLGWHEVFGFEVGTESLLSPSHLLLATAGIFMVAGPLRSAWWHGTPGTFPSWLRWVLPLTMLLSILTSFTAYAHPAVDTWPAAVPINTAQRSALLLVDADGGNQTRVQLDIAEDVWLPAPLPDGSQIVVSAANGEEGSLFRLGADGSNPQMLWGGQGRFNHPAVSPDGTRIAFTANADDGNAEIYVVPIDGGDPTRLTNDSAIDWGPAWSADSESITFVSTRDGDADLYVITAEGGDPVRLTDFDGNEGAPEWSPDGTQIAFESDMDGDYEIYVMQAGGTGVSPLTANNAFDGGPAWSPDGKSIAFMSDRDGNTELYVGDIQGNEPTNLTRNAAADEAWGGIAWMPDGSTILTNTSGWNRADQEPFVRENLGVSALLIQAALAAGVLLLILRHGPLPVGALTVILTINGALMTVFSDTYWYVLPAAAAGVVGDAIGINMRKQDPARRARVLSAAVPATWYALYLLVVGIGEGGLGWSIHMTLGAPFLAGAVGLLMSLLVFPGPIAQRAEPNGRMQ